MVRRSGARLVGGRESVVLLLREEPGTAEHGDAAQALHHPEDVPEVLAPLAVALEL